MSIKYLQLVEACRLNDTRMIIQLSIDQSPLQTYGSPLHLAISLSSRQCIIDLIILTNKSKLSNQWIIALNSDLETPLHLSAKLNRFDILDALFSIESINDTQRDATNHLAIHHSKQEKIIHYLNGNILLNSTSKIRIIEDKKHQFASLILQIVKEYIKEKDTKGLIIYFDTHERANAYLKIGWFDINLPIDSSTEEAILHYSAKWDDAELLNWALQNGADPNVKDKKGKKPFVFCPKKESKTKERLKSAISQTRILSTALASSVVAQNYQGSLQKWTNFAEGYKQRYFVLDQGTLSYFKSQEDYPSSCRGGISMGIASIRLPDPEDKSRFDIIGKGSVRYSLKARTPTDAKKWIWALIESKKWMGDNAKLDDNEKDVGIYGDGDWGSIGNASDMESDYQPDTSSPTKSKQMLLPCKSDLNLMMNSIKVQLDAQQRTIRDIIGSEKYKSDDKEELVVILEKNTLSIKDYVQELMEKYTQNEKEWTLKYRKQCDSSKRWEKIVKNVLDTNQNIQSKEEMIDKDYESEEDEVFYDANEPDARFLEVIFGFDSYVEEIVKPQINVQKQEASFEAAIDLIDFIDHEAIVKSRKGYPKNPRIMLPYDRSTLKPVLNIFSFLKSAIGKDLSKVTLPVFFNEPLSMLQRMSEDIEYSELLSMAALFGNSENSENSTNPSKDLVVCMERLGVTPDELVQIEQNLAEEMRMVYTAAFAVSNYSSTVGRTNKPFNPMLGETFEIVNEEKGYRYVAEQCCHHPPISACYCESKDFIFWSEVNVNSKFWGKSLEIHPLGTCHVKLKSKEGTEHISWKKVTTSVHNLIVGRLWIDHTGDMTLKNWQTQSECKITFKSKSKGWFGSQDTSEGGEINGVLKDKNGLAVWEISGAWHTQISAKRIDQSHLPSFLQGDIVLWKRNTLPTMSLDQFNFTQFAMTLNEMVDAIPKSDSRLRSDQRAMESGNWDAANKNKEIIESIQRRQRTAHIESYNTSGLVSGSTSLQVAKDIGEAWWMPRWFVRIRDEDSGEFHWVSSGEYWKCRQNEWPEFVPDLFTI